MRKLFDKYTREIKANQRDKLYVIFAGRFLILKWDSVGKNEENSTKLIFLVSR